MQNGVHSPKRLAQYLYWDLADRYERQYYFYWMISQIPGRFGNMLRARFCSRHFRKAGPGLQVLAGARFRTIENIAVGSNVMIGPDTFIQAFGGVTLGDHVALAPGVKIWSVNHVYKDRSRMIDQQGLEKHPVRLGNDIWIGSNAFICPGATIPDGMVIAAATVVTRQQYAPYSVIAGNPAKTIGFRE